MRRVSLMLFFCFFTSVFYCQTPTQVIRGKIVDQESKIPLIGATIELLGSENATTTDIDGSFKFDAISIGRQTLKISYLGYEPALLTNLNLIAGKEMVLNIELQEAINVLDEIVVTAKADKQKALNEMASVSSRSFSVEETQKYAASFLDPARMAQNYAGVTSAGDDLSNEIVIRGNSPTYLQWRLEGVEIPSPNHFSSKGSAGGGISMLSNSMLADSDFYTGAFPAEIGNALAGAFDLNFRTGNNEKRENSFMAGVTGVELSAEGPLKKGGKASYLVNYRYSILQLLSLVASLDFGDFDPNFQDLSFKLNFPTEKYGVFSLFGLGAISTAGNAVERDTLQWRNLDDAFNSEESNLYGLIGLNHRYLFKDQKTYIKTVLSANFERYKFEESFLDKTKGLEEIEDESENLTDKGYRINSFINYKSSAQSTTRVGLTYSLLAYDFSFDDRFVFHQGNFIFRYEDLFTLINSRGNTSMFQAYAQHKYRPNNEWTLNGGLHFIHLGITKSYAIEPRFSISRNLNSKHQLAISAGLHSRAEHLINYTLQSEDRLGNPFQPNLDLELTKAAHFVLAYDWKISDKMRMKVEAYYQNLFDVPVDTNFVAGSILNANNVYDVLYNSDAFTNEGSGRNYGIDLTIERFLNNGFYYLLTGSIFESKFIGQDGNTYNTRFNTNFNLTTLAGKEFTVGKSKQNAIAVNTKLIYSGGNRYSEFDFSINELTADGIFKLQADPYFRCDLGLSFKKNRKASTHTMTLDIQNVTNRQNIFELFPDFGLGEYRSSLQNGIIPNINYRVVF